MLRSWPRAVGRLERGQIQARLRPHAAALIPGGIGVALMLVWAVHDGGYDEDTWYWGALVLLALLTAIVVARGVGAIRISQAGRVALVAFALYVAWSYLSITWAQSPGDALTGSNRALLYLLVFAVMLVLPWTVRGALVALLAFALGVGVIGDRAPVPARLRRPRRRPDHRRPAGRADRLLQLDRGAVHDRRRSWRSRSPRGASCPARSAEP